MSQRPLDFCDNSFLCLPSSLVPTSACLPSVPFLPSVTRSLLYAPLTRVRGAAKDALQTQLLPPQPGPLLLQGGLVPLRGRHSRLPSRRPSSPSCSFQSPHIPLLPSPLLQTAHSAGCDGPLLPVAFGRLLALLSSICFLNFSPPLASRAHILLSDHTSHLSPSGS